jgi:hypothetical protein
MSRFFFLIIQVVLPLIWRIRSMVHIDLVHKINYGNNTKARFTVKKYVILNITYIFNPARGQYSGHLQVFLHCNHSVSTIKFQAG